MCHRCVTPSSLRCRNRLRPRLRLLLSSRKRRHRSLRTSRKKRKEKLAEFWSAFLPIVTISLPWEIELRHYRLVSQRHCLHQKRKENGATTHGVLREFASHLCWRCWCPPGQLRQRLRDTQTVCVRYLLCPLLCCVVLGHHYCCCVAVLCCVVLCCVLVLGVRGGSQWSAYRRWVGSGGSS